MGRCLGNYEITTIVSDEAWSQNCYLVRQLPSLQKLLIDPGGDAGRIMQAVRDHEGQLKAILITHAHHDHVAAVADVKRDFDVPCYVHEADKRLLRQAHTCALVFAARNIHPISEVSLYGPDSAPQMEHWPIETIHTPGHSPGSVCYYLDGFVFTGDTLLYQHIGRADTPGSDVAQLQVSMDHLLQKLPPETMVLPGHGRAWSIAEARDWWQGVRMDPPQYKRFGGI